jgi:hypothetical protein
MLPDGSLLSLTFPHSGINGALCRVERLTLPAPGQTAACGWRATATTRDVCDRNRHHC